MGIITLIVMIANITFLIILVIVATRKKIHQTSGMKVMKNYLIDYYIPADGENDDDW